MPQKPGKDRSEGVPSELAYRIAYARVEHNSQRDPFKMLDPDGLSDPELFYSVAGPEADTEYLPAAWVFPIKNGQREVGHIAVGAQRWLPPVLKCSTSPAPQHRLGDFDRHDKLVKPTTQKHRFIYNHPMLFGVEVSVERGGERMFVDLDTGATTEMKAVSAYGPPDSGPTQAEMEWDGIEQHLETGELSYSTSSSGYIGGVPNWGGNVIGGVPNWNGEKCGDDWIGCAPAAGSMIIGYHEPIPSSDKCDVMNDLKDYMGTDSDGLTMPYNPTGGDITDGFEEYDHSYDASNTYPYVGGRRSEIMDQIDSNNPCVVSYCGDKASSTSVESIPGVPDLVGHSEAAWLYEEGDNPWWDPTSPPIYVSTYDTYGGTNELTLGSSSASYFVTSVEP